MDEFTLQWRMQNPGSAAIILRSSEEVVEMHTTYIGDGLGSVLQAAVDLRAGSSSAIGFLPAEPGGTCLFFSSSDSSVYIQVVQFSDMQSERNRWSGGALRWHGRISVGDFVRQVVRMADELLHDCGGAAAYAKAWGGIAFPVENLEVLSWITMVRFRTLLSHYVSDQSCIDNLGE